MAEPVDRSWARRTSLLGAIAFLLAMLSSLSWLFFVYLFFAIWEGWVTLDLMRLSLWGPCALNVAVMILSAIAVKRAMSRRQRLGLPVGALCLSAVQFGLFVWLLRTFFWPPW